MSAISLTVFGSHRPSNIGGILELYLLDREQVELVYDPVRYPLPEASPMTLPGGMLMTKPEAGLIRMKFPPLQCSFGQQMVQNDSGTFADVRIEYSLPGQEAELDDFYHRYCDREYLCLFQDANGQAYLAGNEEKGLRLVKGESIAGVNQKSMALTGRLAVPVLFLHSLVLSELFPDTNLSTLYTLDPNTLLYMTSANYHQVNILAVRRGDTFEANFLIAETVPLAGYTARAQVRKKATDLDVALELDVELEGQTVMLYKAAEQMNLASGAYVYDVEFTDAQGQKVTLMGGRFEVVYDVTR
jgi:hypothetical protein